MVSREDLVFMAFTAKQLSDFSKMIEIIHLLVDQDSCLNFDEQSLFSSAYKGAINLRRKALRSLNSTISHEQSRDNKERVVQLQLLQNKISSELHNLTNDAILLIDTKILVSVKTPFDKLFYFIIKGDFYRYMVECPLNSASSEENTNKSRENYLNAKEIYETLSEKQKFSSRALKFALHYGIFLYHIEHKKDEAISLVENTYNKTEELVEKMESCNYNDNDYSDTMTIFHLMKDHIEIWRNNGELTSFQ